MDGEDKLELFLMVVVGMLYFNILTHVDFVQYAIPIMAATGLLLVFYVGPKVKKFCKKNKVKNKSIMVEGKICDVITTYEKEHFVDSLTIASNEYPVVEFQNDKGDWEKIIVTIPEGENNKFKIDDEVFVWYRYGRKERVQFSNTTFLNKEYYAFHFVDEKIEGFDENFTFGELTFYHENKSIAYTEFKNTMIIREEIVLKKR